MSGLMSTAGNIASYAGYFVLAVIILASLITPFTSTSILAENQIMNVKKSINLLRLSGVMLLFASWITVGGTDEESVRVHLNAVARNFRTIGLIWFILGIICIASETFLKASNKGSDVGKNYLSQLRNGAFIAGIIIMVLSYFLEV